MCVKDSLGVKTVRIVGSDRKPITKIKAMNCPIHSSRDNHLINNTHRNNSNFALLNNNIAIPYSDFDIRCIPEVNIKEDQKLSKYFKIVIDDSYMSIDTAAMAAANKIKVEMLRLNCEYSISIYKCTECGNFYLGRIRKGFKTSVWSDSIKCIYEGTNGKEYTFTHKALVHSHPIIRDPDPCPSAVCDIRGRNPKKGECCKVKAIEMTNDEFSYADYSELCRLGTSNGYLVTKKESGWTLMKFVMPQTAEDINKLRNVSNSEDYKIIKKMIADERLMTTSVLDTNDVVNWTPFKKSALLLHGE
jgi:hypothetical protein